MGQEQARPKGPKPERPRAEVGFWGGAASQVQHLFFLYKQCKSSRMTVSLAITVGPLTQAWRVWDWKQRTSIIRVTRILNRIKVVYSLNETK